MRTFFSVLALVVCVASGAQAQSRPQPTRPSPGLFGGGRPIDPNRASQELSLSANLLAGYGDFLTPGSDPLAGPQSRTSATTATLDAGLLYRYGKASRFFSADGRMMSAAYGQGIDPTFGGRLNLRGQSNLGARSTLGFSQSLSYEPSLVLGALSPIQGGLDVDPVPDIENTSGIAEQRSWSTVSEVNASHGWTTRQTTSGGFSVGRIRYLNSVGYDNNTLGASIRHSKSFSRTSSLNAGYRYSESEVVEDGGRVFPMIDHTIDAGAEYSRRLSPTRRIRFDGTLGASRIETVNPSTLVPVSYWTPSGSGGVRVDLGRTWALRADYRRAVNVLPGAAVGSFATNSFRVQGDGRLGRRLDAGLVAGLADGRSGAVLDGGRFRLYTASAQTRFALARCCATSVNYDFHYYRMQDVTGLPEGLPSRYDRHSVRVGLTLFVPLYGSFVGQR